MASKIAIVYLRKKVRTTDHLVNIGVSCRMSNIYSVMDGDFDPEEHDAMMRKMFDEDYYEENDDGKSRRFDS